MPASKLDSLIKRITALFRRRAAACGLEASAVETRYILNMGGFVNASFFIRDGQKTLHLKLADDEDQQESLRRWYALREPLAERYRAPRVLDWVEIPSTPYAGLLSEYIPGKPADLAAQPAVLEGMRDLLARLHADRGLAAALTALDEEAGYSEPGETPTCGDYFLSVYIDRFDEDLLTVAGDLPPFVSLDLLSWMMGETRELEGLARDLPAFAAPAAAPVHGDLGANNILVTAAGDWRVIDWDDLALGDPALEYGILLGPLWQGGAITREQALSMLPADDALRARFEVCLRAFVLDQVIDTLADWVECQFSPTHAAEVRAAKEAAHRSALALYQQLWGGGGRGEEIEIGD